MQIEAALERYTTQMRANGRTAHTVRQIVRHVTRFGAWARESAPCGADLDALDHQRVAEFLSAPAAFESARGGRKRAASLNCLRSSLRSFLRYAYEARLAPKDHGLLIKQGRCSPPVPRGVSDGDLEKLLEAASKASGPEAARDRLFVELLAATGLRLGSAIAIDVEDIDLLDASIEVRSTKNSSPTRIFLGATIRQSIARYLGQRTSGPLLADRTGRRITPRHAQRRLAQLAKTAGIARPLSPHALRHGFAMRLYERTGDVELVRTALHHRSVTSTIVYARCSEQRLRSVL